MATSNDHPGLPFVQAQGFTRGRPDGPPLWIVIHTMEASEFSQRAETTAIYFADPPDDRQVSSHYCVDNDSVVQCVDLDDSAWTVGNRPGNNRGLNWEFSGFANQSRDQWLDSFGRAMLAQAAPLMRLDSQRFNVPVRRCTVAELTALRPGFTTHNDLRMAFGVTTHTDPGSGFPFDYLFDLINGSEDEVEMFLTQVTGSQAVYVSTGIKFRQVSNLATLNRYRNELGLRTVIVSNEADLLDLCGEREVPGPDPVTITSQQVQLLTDAAHSGAESGARVGVEEVFDGATITTTIETSDTP